MAETYLPAGLPAPLAMNDGLDTTYWEGTRAHKLQVQRCQDCQTWQWGPEWVCNNCLSFNVGWEEVEPTGRIYSWIRAWNPVHPALKEAMPYLVVLVELPQAGDIRMVGNLLGDRQQDVRIGDDVEAVFEDHHDADPPFTLVQWHVTGR